MEPVTLLSGVTSKYVKICENWTARSGSPETASHISTPHSELGQAAAALSPQQPFPAPPRCAPAPVPHPGRPRTLSLHTLGARHTSGPPHRADPAAIPPCTLNAGRPLTARRRRAVPGSAALPAPGPRGPSRRGRAWSWRQGIKSSRQGRLLSCQSRWEGLGRGRGTMINPNYYPWGYDSDNGEHRHRLCSAVGCPGPRLGVPSGSPSGGTPSCF